MAENRRPHGARDEADGVDQKRLERADQRVGLREIEFREHQPRHRAVKKEVVPLDGGADGAGDDRAAQLPGMIFR
jgi:hypothetical protein